MWLLAGARTPPPAHPSSGRSSLNNNEEMGGKALVVGIHLAKSLSIVEKKMCLMIHEAAPITITRTFS